MILWHIKIIIESLVYLLYLKNSYVITVFKDTVMICKPLVLITISIITNTELKFS